MLPDNPIEQYGMVNINTLGIGTYDSTEGTTFQMRGIYSANASLTVTLDAANGAILLTLDVGSIIDDLPQATTTQRGVGETATDAEAIAKVSTTVFVTPSNFAAMAASQTFAGLVELATDAETQAGVSTTLAVTPAGLASVILTFQETTTWADAVARAGADPDFDGQFGVQLDSNVAYVSAGTAVGDFNLPIMMLGNLSNLLPADTQLDLNSQVLVFSGPGTISIQGSTVLDYDGGTVSFNNTTVRFGNASSTILNFGTNCVIQDNAVTVPASSVLTTSATPGQFNSLLINTFLSTANVQTYGLPTSTLARTTFATYAGQAISNPPTQAEVQALDNAVVIVSQRLGALITDLMATLKPHA